MSGLVEQAKEKIEELIERAEAVADEAEAYIDKASAINHAHWVNSSRDNIPLDDQPLGEELARLDKAPEALRELVVELQRTIVERTPLADLDEQIESAEEQIDGVVSTLGDVTDLPDDDDDDDLPS